MNLNEEQLEILQDMANELSHQASGMAACGEYDVGADGKLLFPGAVDAEIEPEQVLEAIFDAMNAILYHDRTYRERLAPEANHLGEFLAAKFLTKQTAEL